MACQEIMKNAENDDTFRNNLNILVAEDNLMVQQSIELILDSTNCNLFMVENGKLVLEALERNHYDLVLLDLQMPEMDGFETITHIRERECKPDEHIPVLAMTGYYLGNGRQKCINAGMDDYLEKPFMIEDLIEAIERLTHTKVYFKKN
jgi:Response regulator containing CheY-like receiver, AAA-type ATPase, and DNA-binding domains